MKLLHGAMFSLLLAMATAASAAPFVLFNTNGGTGAIIGSYPSFTLNGADNAGASIIDNYTLYIELVDASETLTFNWLYATLDDGGAAWDPAGYLINNTLYQLSPASSGAGIISAGTLTVTLAAGDTFGWYVNSIDSRNGPGLLAIAVTDETLTPAPVSAVPEPASLGMLLSGLLLVGGLARRRR